MTSHNTMPDQPQSEPNLRSIFSTIGSIRSKLPFAIEPANSCKLCCELDEVIERSRHARRAKRQPKTPSARE